MAAIFAAREAILSEVAFASDDLHQAKEISKRTKSKASEFYIRKLDALIQNPRKASYILSPESAKQFIKVESKPLQYRIEKTEKGQILWIPSKKNQRG